jgi:hypothetical protein
MGVHLELLPYLLEYLLSSNSPSLNTQSLKHSLDSLLRKISIHNHPLRSPRSLFYNLSVSIFFQSFMWLWIYLALPLFSDNVGARWRLLVE